MQAANGLVLREEEELLPYSDNHTLHKYEVASPAFHKAVLAGCGFAWLCIAGCISVAICIFDSDTETHLFGLTSLSDTGSEISAFVVNMLITLLTEVLGYIYSTSLRWALYREGCLEFNTNIRLLTSARSSAPN